MKFRRRRRYMRLDADSSQLHVVSLNLKHHDLVRRPRDERRAVAVEGGKPRQSNGISRKLKRRRRPPILAIGRLGPGSSPVMTGRLISRHG
jgi:hypothetical protein